MERTDGRPNTWSDLRLDVSAFEEHRWSVGGTSTRGRDQIDPFWHQVKLIDAADLRRWHGVPAYGDHEALSFADYWAAGHDSVSFVRSCKQLLDDLCEQERLDTPSLERYDTLSVPLPRSLRRREERISLPPAIHEGTIDTTGSPDARIVDGELVVQLTRRKGSCRVERFAPAATVHAERIRELEAAIDAHPAEQVGRLRAIRDAGRLAPVLFISHRWEHPENPDPNGAQLAKLRSLENCYLVYDYASFPQQTRREASHQALQQILENMNQLLRNVVVLDSPGYTGRGWCFYEYLVANLTRQVVCDELADERFVLVRNAAASEPPPHSSDPAAAAREVIRGGHSVRNEAQNAIAEALAQSVERIAPSFKAADFTVAEDRAIVRHLLSEALARALPAKKEYPSPYLGEWQETDWTVDEVGAMLDGEAPASGLQVAHDLDLFEPDVPRDLSTASTRRYVVQRQQTWSPYWEIELLGKALTGLGPVFRGVAFAVAAVVAVVAFAVVGAAGGAAILLLWSPPAWLAWATRAVVAVCLSLLAILAWIAIALLRGK